MRLSNSVAIFCACMSTLVPLTSGAAPLPPVAPAFTVWATYLSGTWSCQSGSTPYTVSYERALSGHWIRGINTSAASQSEDMLSYNAKEKKWTLYDMEPTGDSFSMRGPSTGSAIRLSDKSAHFSVSLERVNAGTYRLQFGDGNGKPSGKPDVCTRRH
jgi:hypothetical protein